jgi:Putative restriction endonuclease
MATLSTTSHRPELFSGDRMSQDEFHRLYCDVSENFIAELIGGTVFVASPLRRQHGVMHALLGSIYVAYQGMTPGIEVGDNATILLGSEAEPQPDLYLRVLPEWGGRSRTTPDDYVQGPPEFLTEVAHSSRAIDLHAKYDDYSRYGVLEYLVVCLDEKELRWFDLQQDCELQPDVDGVYRIRTFPGLWIHGAALLAGDHAGMLKTLQEGLATAEHAAFVGRLAEQWARGQRS